MNRVSVKVGFPFWFREMDLDFCATATGLQRTTQHRLSRAFCIIIINSCKKLPSSSLLLMWHWSSEGRAGSPVRAALQLCWQRDEGHLLTHVCIIAEAHVHLMVLCDQCCNTLSATGPETDTLSLFVFVSPTVHKWMYLFHWSKWLYPAAMQHCVFALHKISFEVFFILY